MLRCTAVSLAITLVGAQDPLRVSDAAGLRAALAAATPGATIVLASGEYGAIHATGVRGTAKAPITVRAESAASPPVLVAGMQLSDVEHLVLERLVIAGAANNGLNIDDGGTFATPSHHVALRWLTVRDVGGRDNHDGIKLSGVVDFVLADCTIERWGRNGSAVDMVGCQRGRLERCTIRDRADNPAANGVQMKGGTRDVVVHRCRFEHAGQRAVQLGGSTARDHFRPAPAGFEAKDLVVEGCTFIGSLSPIAFVGCDGATVRWNTIHLPTKWVLRILQETRDADFVPCRNGVFTDNLIVWRGLDVVANVGDDTAPATFAFARNWWFRVDDPQHSIPRLPTAEVAATGGSDPGLAVDPSGDLRPAAGSPARRYGAHALPEATTPARKAF